MASLSQDRDVRVGDYLDDKLQTLADLESLDSLLINVRNQQSLLQRQLEDAQKDLHDARSASTEHGSSVNTRVQKFHREQRDIDQRLLVVTNSDTSDDAVRRFEKSMDKLRRLDVTKGYVQLLKDVDSLSDECLSNLGSSDAAALEAYKKLYKLSADLGPLQEAAEGAAPHLVHHIISKTNDVHGKIEEAFSGHFEEILKKISWPSPEASVPDTLQQELSDCVGKLLDLQMPELEAQERASDKATYTIAPLVLLPLKVLVKPLELGFRYHFEGNKPTNRLERPEFFLSHVTDRILTKYIGFIETYIRPLLRQKFRGTNLAMNYAYIDDASAFITALLPMVRKKLLSVLPQVLKQPPLLSHMIHEVMKFDTNLRDEWQYDGGSRTESWRGLAWEILAQDDIFGHWLKAEKDFALSRYHEIVEATDSFDLDFDSVGHGRTKPSKAAIHVNDLLEATTYNYRELVSFSQKLRFLIDIQISIFDLFHQRLADFLAAYLARTSLIGRASKEEQASLQGIAGLERLCRVFGSADFIERAMRDWNDDVFFLELWSELQHRASQRSAQATVAGSMTVAQVAARTSSTINADPSDSGLNGFEEGALFDETAASYDRIRSRTETIIVELLTNNVRLALGAYTKINPWSTLAAAPTHGADTQLAPTAELDGLLLTLSTLIGYLSRALGTVPLRRLVKQTLQTIDTTLTEQVLLRHSFSGAGVAQFSADLAAIGTVVAKIIDFGIVDAGLGRVKQAARLLGVPIKGKEGKKDEDSEAKAGDVGLFEAGKRLFEGSGDDAKELLEEMGLDQLSVGDARKILARRVELGS